MHRFAKSTEWRFEELNIIEWNVDEKFCKNCNQVTDWKGYNFRPADGDHLFCNICGVEEQ